MSTLSTPTSADRLSPSPVSASGSSSDGRFSPILQPVQPLWNRPRSNMAARSARTPSGFSSGAGSLTTPNNLLDRLINDIRRTLERIWISFVALTLLQKAIAVLVALALAGLGVGFMILTGKLFDWLEPVAEDWEKKAPTYIVLWLLTFCVSFPPIVGWSTIGTVCGFIFGVWKGWLLFSFGSIVGSTCSFIACRTLLSNYVHRLMERDKRFAAMALTLKYDGLKLLCMIRLCPLPYSICNGAVSTFPTVRPLMYGLATALISPKFLIPVFVGSRLRILTRDNEKMSVGSKIINIVSVLFSIAVGIFTGWYIYKRTLARARQLEEEERTARRRSLQTRRPSSNLPPPSAFADEPDLPSPFRSRHRDEEGRIGGDGNGGVDSFQDDAIALDLDDDNVLIGSDGYHDEFTDNDSDVFDDGDGDVAEESYSLHRRVD